MNLLVVYIIGSDADPDNGRSPGSKSLQMIRIRIMGDLQDPNTLQMIRIWEANTLTFCQKVQLTITGTLIVFYIYYYDVNFVLIFSSSLIQVDFLFFDPDPHGG